MIVTESWVLSYDIEQGGDSDDVRKKQHSDQGVCRPSIINTQLSRNILQEKKILGEEETSCHFCNTLK